MNNYASLFYRTFVGSTRTFANDFYTRNARNTKGYVFYCIECIETEASFLCAGDVYSFAIILEEIVVRGGPYETARQYLDSKG